MSYWRKVLAGAWKKTLPTGWNRHKVAALVVTVLAGFLAGGFTGAWSAMPLTIGVLLAAVPVGIALFIWGAIETQAELYAELEKKPPEVRIERIIVEGKPKQQSLQDQPPDYDKWRHVERMTLRNASQLWSDVRPQAGLFGGAKETYEMLRAAIQKGELAFELEHQVAPHMRAAMMQTRRENPNQDVFVTRTALKAFAAKYGYKPKFLRD